MSEGGTTDNSIDGSTFHGPVVQARNVHVHLPAAAAEMFAALERSAPPAPWPLEPPVRDFANHEREIGALVGDFEEASARPADGPVVSLVTGIPGIGKTATVLIAVHRARSDCFPDGALYTDLRPLRRDGFVDVEALLGGFLEQLGVPPERQPTGLAARRDAFRSAAAGRRMLVFLDNVQSAAEVAQLSPVSGAVVATASGASVTALKDGLLAHGRCRLRELGGLDEAAGVRLMRGRLDAACDPRSADGALAELAALCCGLPLALGAVLGLLITRRTSTVRDIVEQLRERGGVLGMADRQAPGLGEAEGRQLVERVCGELPPELRRSLALLGALPGETFTVRLAEAVGVVAPHGLDALLDTGFVERCGGGGDPARFRLQGLIRAHVAGWDSGVPAGELSAAVLGHYLRSAVAADRMTMGERRLLGADGLGDGPSEAFPDAAAASAWLDAERPAFLAVLRDGGAAGLHGQVWRLCQALWALYHSRKPYAEWIEAHELAIESAVLDGRADAEIRLRNQLARAHYELAEYGAALDALGRAEQLLARPEAARERWLAGAVRETAGLIALAQDEPERAAALFAAALADNEGDAHGIAVQRYNLAQAHLARGRTAEADAALDRAAEAEPGGAGRAMRPRIALVRGRVRLAEGDVPGALAALRAAVAAAEEVGNRAKQLDALQLLAETARAAGDGELADECESRLRAAGAAQGR